MLAPPVTHHGKSIGHLYNGWMKIQLLKNIILKYEGKKKKKLLLGTRTGENAETVFQFFSSNPPFCTIWPFKPVHLLSDLKKHT